MPDQELLRALFRYNPETGELLRSNGKVAGWLQKTNGYRMVGIGRRHNMFLVHRIIWKLVTGEDPVSVDHADLDKQNNRWSNLRHCTKTLNQGNRTKRSDNKSGFKGVSWDGSRGLWRAQICKDERRTFIGRFADVEAAHAAFAAKAIELYGEFARAA